VLPFPPAANRDTRIVGQLADVCGVQGARQLPADLIADHLGAWYADPARRFLGSDRDTGEPRWKPRPPNASYNRMRSTLSALLKYAKRQRFLPRSGRIPCSTWKPSPMTTRTCVF